MPDKRHHRGQHPEDARLFADDRLADLRSAVADLSLLLSRGYAQPSALKVVGDRYNLEARQRMAMMRAACTDQALQARAGTRVSCEAMRGKALLIDGYNVLTTVEAALAGGVILLARDATYRDIASMHGSFRKVEETMPALELVGEVAGDLGIAQCTWFLDAPVSNSGRLKQIIDARAGERGWNWHVEIVNNPDAVLSQASEIIASADSVILDRCQRWFALANEVVQRRVQHARVLDLMDNRTPSPRYSGERAGERG
jgi:hypothetical protein